MGSNTTMLYPCSVLKGDNSSASQLGVAFANVGQNQDTGVKIIYIGKNTSSTIVTKSISKGGGISTYRGLVDIKPGAVGPTSQIDCNGLLLDNKSVSDTIPLIKIGNADSLVAHEASAGKINPDYLFYLQSRGIEYRRRG